MVGMSSQPCGIGVVARKDSTLQEGDDLAERALGVQLQLVLVGDAEVLIGVWPALHGWPSR